MMVEFTGPTGAGKSTLAGRVILALRERDIPVVAVHKGESSIASPLPEALRLPGRHRLRTDLILIPWVLRALLQSPRFHLSLLADAMRSPSCVSVKASVFRSVWRKIGLATLLGAPRFKDKVCIIDEGLVHSAHNVFVDAKNPPDLNKVAVFARKVPVPDLLVLVRAAAPVLLERALRRDDRSPRMREAGMVPGFVSHADAVFAALAAAFQDRPRVLAVDGDASPAGTPREEAERIVNAVLAQRS